MFDETHAMQISEYLCFTYQIVAFFSGSKKSHEFGTIEIPKSACFAQLKPVSYTHLTLPTIA